MPIKLTAAVTLIAISVIASLGWFILGGSPFNLVEVGIERSISAAVVKSIQVQSAMADVEVIPAKGDQIEVRLYGKTTQKWKNDYDIVTTTENGQVTIEVKEKTKTRFFDVYNKIHLSVMVPNQVLELIKVNTDTETIRIQDINAQKFALASDTGNIDVNAPSGAFELKSDTGKITLDLQGIKHPITAKTDTGDITVRVKETPSALQTSLKSDSGKTTAELPGLSNGTIATGGPMVELISDSGNVKLYQK